MDSPDWKSDLRSCLEDLRVIDRCRAEAVAQFDQFCGHVVGPAFEVLAAEFERYDIKSQSTWIKGASIQFEVRFPGSGEDQFHYALWLPKQAVELKLKLTLRGRNSPGAPLEEKTIPFVSKALPGEILKIDKDLLAQDVVARYRKFLYETAVLSE